MEVVAATPLDEDRVAVLLADAGALIPLEGSPRELGRLCEAMEQASLLARATHRDSALAQVRVGTDVVSLGIRRGRVRMTVTRATRAPRP